MKGRVIVVREAERGEIAAALIEDGRITDLVFDPPLRDGRGPVPLPGAIYRGKVTSQSGKLGTFVDIGDGETAFLKGQPRHRPGAEVVVQITGYAEPGKAWPAGDRILLKNQLLILTPGAPGVNVSRQIRDTDERARLLAAVGEADARIRAEPTTPDWPGVAAQLDRSGIIVRSAAKGADEGLIANDLLQLAQRLADIDAVLARGGAPGLAFGASQALETAFTDWASPRPDAVHVRVRGDSWGAIDSLCAESGWSRSFVVETDDPFEHFGVWDEVDRLRSARADLPSGAWMSVEATRALVAVDVNTGAQFSPAAALTANLEAVRELPRQLRLRGFGGQVAVDFAPVKKAERKRLEEALKAAFRRDPVETSLAGWTPLGLFELQRKRERRPITECLPPR